ncbi:MAG TPA: M3 family metallopeptidase [Steroidobacteraceae bacterium]|jgi:peptidyl-dipeptidase Dcp|nr:M3 family metallopeptidase [Steroidobacteraceae bacterium]
MPHRSQLLEPWTGPLESPPFHKVTAADFEPAFAVAFPANLVEIERIAAETAPPSFDNTIAALESSGRLLNRVHSVFGALSGTMADKPLQAVEQRLSPQFASHNDAIALKTGLYERVAAVNATAANSDLTPEQRRVTERYAVQFVRRGAQLSDVAKARLTLINQRLATLYTTFSQNLLADEENYSLVLDSEADLAGCPEALRSAAAAAAVDRQLPGKWLIANTRSAMEPFLTYADRRDLRERGWRMWISRGDNGNTHDNKRGIGEILALRAERARLLGFATHADYQLADSMAKTPQAGLDLIKAVWQPAVQAAHTDRAAFQAMIDSEGGGFALQPWDWRYYAERTRRTQYDVDEAQIKPYLQLDNMQQAAFWCAGRLYGLKFEPRTDIAVYHPDVHVFTVRDRDQSELGLFYFDPYARPGKNSGAWMNEFRAAESFAGRELPLIVNVCNFTRPAPGAPALLSMDDMITLFHEFGHALHGLLSRTAYPLVAGTNVSRDFVEFPSQINEHWATCPDVLERHALHYETGESMPRALIERVLRARKFNQAFATVEFLAAAWVDMDIHLAADPPADIAAFEQASLTRLGMPPEIVMRHRPTQFAHIFGSDGYSASYYAYLWAQVLDHDGFAAFEEAGDVFDPAVARRLREEVLERGNSRDPALSYRAFRGRDPRIDALLRNRGLAAPGDS